MAPLTASLLGLCALCAASAASADEPHDHSGKLTPYSIGPPSVTLSRTDEASLAAGKPLMQTVIASDQSSRRMLVVQDVPAPAGVVMERIMDLEKYDKMVDGVNSLVNYASEEHDGLKIVKSEYDIQAMHLKFKYFMKHTYDPAQLCMTFALDYDRKSDIDDSVGYWYVLPRGRADSRVYYSCDTKLRGWVPGPVYNMLTKEALKKATTWVARESIKEWRTQQNSPFGGDGFVRFVENVREAMPAVKLPQPPLLVNNWLHKRRRGIVQFVSAGRPAKLARSMASS